jgi:hypothetical protein
MWEDPIVAEVHRARQAIFAQFDNDMGAYLSYIREQEEEERKSGREFITKPLRNRKRVDLLSPAEKV